MPLDLSCPKCNHVFPVTEARHTVGVQCPGCDAELTAEFRKVPPPVNPGQPPYELLVSVGKPPGAPPAVSGGGKKLRLDDEDGPQRGGGSMTVVLLAGIGALLVTLGGLGATGYFLFTNLDTSDATVNTISGNTSGGNTGSSGKGGNRGGTKSGIPVGAGGGGFPSFPGGGGGGGGFTEPPKPKDTFDLKPVSGPAPAFAPLALPSDPSTVDLGGKVGQVAVGGGGRYVVLHFPDKGQLGVFDACTGQFNAVAADTGDVRLAAGASRVVLYVRGPKIFRFYSLPDLSKQFDASTDLFFSAPSIAMGNRTDGPLLVDAAFGETRLYDVSGGEMKEIEGARGKPGIHSTDNGLRALPDGTAFATFDGFGNGQKTTLLHVQGRKWKVERDVNQVPFPGVDGHFYGNGVVVDKNGKDMKFGGVGAASNNWYVPATSSGKYFLKVAPVTVSSGGREKKTVSVTIHAAKKADTPAPGTRALTDLPEFEDLVDPWGNINWDKPLDRHFFLIPEAKLLVILNGKKDKLVLRSIDLK
jgi:hypothetical protein